MQQKNATMVIVGGGTMKQNGKKKKKDMRSFIRIRYGILGQTMNIPGKSGRKISSLVYIVARRLIGFN